MEGPLFAALAIGHQPSYAPAGPARMSVQNVDGRNVWRHERTWPQPGRLAPPPLPAPLPAELGCRLALCLACRLWLTCDQEGATIPGGLCRPSRLQHLSDRPQHDRTPVDERATDQCRVRPLFLAKVYGG
jgi:hypothetical protein